MRRFLRTILDKLFTSVSGLSVLFMGGALLIILGPMIVRGASAVVFDGTVEFRKLQFRNPLFERGDREAVEQEVRQSDAARRPVYEALDRFAMGVDVEPRMDRVKHIYRELRDQIDNRLENREMSDERADLLRSKSRRVRRTLEDAFETTDRQEAINLLAEVADDPQRDVFDGTIAEEYYRMAAAYREVVEIVDLTKRTEYLEPLQELQELIYELFGPRPGEDPKAPIAQFKYGATRMDMAGDLRQRILTATRRELDPERSILVPVEAPRRELFDGGLDDLFDRFADDEQFEAMMLPESTFYWQFFIDDSTPGHYFGGVGPEILGTLLLTLLAMLFSVPVGIMTAAYLVECAGDNHFVRFIRMCINTLAGVPSIVFGLFGLAFIVLWLQPSMGLEKQSSIFAGALTLAVLVLPIIIRASEEAIRAVPRSYKEASLSLGAGGLRTFLVVTLPAAMPGILTGIILSMSRAAGETAPILFTAAVAYRVGMPHSLFSGGTRALSYGSYDLATNDVIAMKVPHNQYGMIMTLILIVLALNITAIIIRGRLAKKLRG